MDIYVSKGQVGLNVADKAPDYTLITSTDSDDTFAVLVLTNHCTSISISVFQKLLRKISLKFRLAKSVIVSIIAAFICSSMTLNSRLLNYPNHLLFLLQDLQGFRLTRCNTA